MANRKSFSLNRLAWPMRLPVKWAMFGLATFAVCFPSPSILVRHIQHWRNPNKLIEPNAPSLAPMKTALESKLVGVTSDQQKLQAVESLVLEKVPYDWDWNTWGTADYIPTVAEAMEMGREDCDGRAVVAASLLKHLGFDATIVTDFAHVWVKTEAGEVMGPGNQKAIEATDGGLKINWSGLAMLPSAAAYGLAVFPLVREIILLVVLWLLFRRRRKGFLYDLVALGLLVGALVLLRIGGQDYRAPIFWLQWLGAIAVLVALSVMVARSISWQSSTEHEAM